MRLRRPVSPVHLLRQVAALAVLAFALTLALRPAPAPAEQAVDTAVPVLVAAADLPAGTVLSPEHVTVRQVPPDARPAGSAGELGQLSGRVLAAPLRVGEPVTDVRLVGTGVTALLPSGQVAAPVRLADLAVAALVRGGDRIDVLATVDGSPSAEVVAEDALVLAAPAPPGGSSEDASAGLLLVAVEPSVAARLAAAATSATLTITLPPQ